MCYLVFRSDDRFVWIKGKETWVCDDIYQTTLIGWEVFNIPEGEVQIAIEEMHKKEHAIAQFGVNNSFVITKTFDN